MKKILNLFIASIPAIIFLACDDDGTRVESETVQFSFSQLAAENSDGRLQELPDNIRLYVSLENSAGRVTKNEVLDILAFGDSYITESVQLPLGRYSIKDFFILNSSNEILFATPKRGSLLSSSVNHPLPFSFAVGKGKVATIDMQVIDVAKHSPQAFGYAAFNISVVNPLPISVLAEQNGDFILTDATGFIYEAASNVFTQQFSLAAKLNYVSFIGDPEAEYRLAIQKNGYVQYSKTFSYNALMEELSGETLNVFLTPIPSADTFSFRNYYGSGTFSFDVSFEGTGSVSVDWGDGASEIISFSPSSSAQQIAHNYVSAAQFNVVFTGNLDQIVSFQDNLGFVSEVDLAGLPHLTSLTLQSGQMLLLDVSRAYELESLTLRSMDIIDVKLENNPYLKNLTIEVIYSLLADSMIAKFHDNVVEEGIRDGTIITTRVFPELSNASRSLIFDLRDHYNFLWINEDY
jgi:hypothetical protein